MEYSKEEFNSSKKANFGSGREHGTEESKKIWRKTHNFGIMQWVTNPMNFTER